MWRGVELKRLREADGISCYRGMIGESDGTCESPDHRGNLFLASKIAILRMFLAS